MKKYLAVLLTTCFLVGCSGIPLTSIPNLLRLQISLLDMNPAELMLEVQVDTKMVPSPVAVPMLHLAIQPSEVGAFEPIDSKLPMRFSVISTDTPGLPAPPEYRRWLVYSLAPEFKLNCFIVKTPSSACGIGRHMAV